MRLEFLVHKYNIIAQNQKDANKKLEKSEKKLNNLLETWIKNSRDIKSPIRIEFLREISSLNNSINLKNLNGLDLSQSMASKALNQSFKLAPPAPEIEKRSKLSIDPAPLPPKPVLFQRSRTNSTIEGSKTSLKSREPSNAEKNRTITNLSCLPLRVFSQT